MIEKELPDSIGPWLFLTENGPVAVQIIDVGTAVMTSTGLAAEGRWIKIKTPHEWRPKFEPEFPDFMPEGWWVTQDHCGVSFHDRKPSGFYNHGWSNDHEIMSELDRLNYDWSKTFGDTEDEEACFQKPTKKENNDH